MVVHDLVGSEQGGEYIPRHLGVFGIAKTKMRKKEYT
jgi:hypothetical protein